MIELEFTPFPYLLNPHAQTILGSILGRWSTEPPSLEKLISLPDGDQISLQITTPKKWKANHPTVLLVHGLCGSHRSPYLVRMAKRLQPLGIRTIRLNLRGCGSGKRLARQLYHAGRSEDIHEVLKKMKDAHPESPFVLIGYSLGANLVLKLAGELQEKEEGLIDQVIAVSPPSDLFASVQKFNQKENAFYEKIFSKELCAHLLALHTEFETGPPTSLAKNLTVMEFDHLFTAPRCGFKDALDYYKACSSAQFVSNIKIPCKILFSKDDPLVCHSTLDALVLPKNVQVFKTEKGGHLGFLGNPFSKRGLRWLDSLLVEWIL